MLHNFMAAVCEAGLTQALLAAQDVAMALVERAFDYFRDLYLIAPRNRTELVLPLIAAAKART